MKAFQRLLVAAPAAALLPVALAPMGVLANDLNLDLDTVQEYSVAQGASIRDFSDVYPTDWAYQALAELVETYGCVSGYPDGTFRGDQPITRYEMAAILSACLDSMSAMENDSGAMEDMEMLKAEFQDELIELKGEVDGLTAKVGALEETQFSTTTKAEFEIATDFTYFSTDNEEARGSSTTMVDLEEDDEDYWEHEPGELPPLVEAVEAVPAETIMITGSVWDTTLFNAGGIYSDYATDGSSTADTHALIPVFYDEEDDENRNGMVIDADEDTDGITFLINTNVGEDDAPDNSAKATIPTASLTTANTNHYAVVERPRIWSDANDNNEIDDGEVVYASNAQLVGDEFTLVEVTTDEDGEEEFAEGETVNSLEWINDNLEMTEAVAGVAEVPHPGIPSGEQREVVTPYGEDNSGLALSSSVEINFVTSFTGSDKLTFKLGGDVMSVENHYLALGNFYDVADNSNNHIEFKGFTYERNFDLGVPFSVILGTDFADLDAIEGREHYYPYDGYYDYEIKDFGDAGFGFNVALLDSDAGTVNFSASYAVDGDNASDQTGKKGFFGEDTDRSFAVGLNWDGDLFGGNQALFTVAYQNISENEADYNMEHGGHYHKMTDGRTKSIVHLLAGVYLTDTISLNGIYSFGTWNYDSYGDEKTAQWSFAFNVDDAFFPGNSAGIAYGAPEHVTDVAGMDPIKVLELYYSFKVNDNFTIPVYMDFISNAGNAMMGNGTNKDAFAIAVRPKLTF